MCRTRVVGRLYRAGQMMLESVDEWSVGLMSWKSASRRRNRERSTVQHVEITSGVYADSACTTPRHQRPQVDNTAMSFYHIVWFAMAPLTGAPQYTTRVIRKHGVTRSQAVARTAVLTHSRLSSNAIRLTWRQQSPDPSIPHIPFPTCL